MCALRLRLPLFRFSLRTLLVLVTVFGVWLGVQLNRAQQQRAAVRSIQQYGGSALYDFEYDRLGGTPKPDAPGEPKWLIDLLGIDFFHHVWSVNLAWAYDKDQTRWDTKNVAPEVVAHLAHLPALKSLLLQGPQASDDTMQYVGNLRQLEELMIVTRYYTQGTTTRALRPKVTDQGMAQLRSLGKLRVVYVDDVAISDRSLEVLGKLRQLEEITLQGPACSFTDDGMKELGQLTRLRKLVFNIGYGSNECSDAGLARIEGLEELRELWLRGEHISEQALLRLAALPHLKQLRLSTNGVTRESVQRFQEAVPAVACYVSPYVSFDEDMPKIVAIVLRIDPALVKPESLVSELCGNERRRARLVGALRKDYFGLDEDEAENVRQFAGRALSDESLTVSQLADLVRQTVGR